MATISPEASSVELPASSAILEAVNLLAAPCGVVELRALKVPRWGRRGGTDTHAGYFDDFRKLAAAAASLLDRAYGQYITLNPVRPDLLARGSNRLVVSPEALTTDTEILSRHLLLVDVDPRRPSGVSSSTAEHHLALELCSRIEEDLRRDGWPDPFRIASGNGGHLRYRIDLPADDGGLVKRVLAALAARYNDERVEVDKGVFNPARIARLPGTWARKGDSTAERPHRLARIERAPDGGPQVVAAELLEALAAEVPSKPQPRPQRAAAPRSSAWAEAARAREVGAVLDSGNGERNLRLNDAAFSLGQIVGGGGLERSRVEADLIAAAEAAGLLEPEISKTIASGLDAGGREPRVAPRPLVGVERVATTGPAGSEVVEIDRYHLTDLGNADHFYADHGRDLLYSYARGKFMAWDGRRWEQDETGESERRAADTIRRRYRAALDEPDEKERTKLVMHAIKSEKVERIFGMIKAARNRFAVRLKLLDSHPFLLNFLNGTLDLQGGEFREHRREDLLTTLVPHNYIPDAQAPRWVRFVSEIMQGRAELITFMQRFFGYCLSGSVREHALFVGLGDGANGKGTVFETLRYVMGDDLVAVAPPGLLIASRNANDRHPVEIKRLLGKRLINDSEVPKGATWNEERVKRMAGGDALSARGMHEEFQDFRPTFKLALIMNDLPRVRDASPGFWRRMRIVPFDVSFIGKEDKTLDTTLQGEAEGILAWLVRGCLEWQREGLGEPVEVRDAVARYRETQDVVRRFLDETEVTRPTVAKQLYGDFRTWLIDQGERELSQTVFGGELKRLGWTRERETLDGGKKLTVWTPPARTEGEVV